MRDGFGREVDYLRLSVTDLCNYRCQYCMPAEGVCKREHGEILRVEECVEIVRAAADCGIKKVRLTGGEPLVRRGILDICRGIAAIPEIGELCLTTNGSLLPRLAVPLREAGVDRLNISLDTLNPDRFRAVTRTGELKQVLDGIAAAEKAGFTGLKLNAVLMKGFNDDEICGLVDLARRYPVEVRFIERMPVGEGPNARFLSAGAVLEACPDLRPAAGSGVARRYRPPGGRGLVGLIEPMSRPFCAGCNRVRVTADGRLKPCLHSGRELPLRGLRGEELRRAIERGIAAKPEGHHMTETGRSEAGRTMNRIGG